MIFPKPLLLLMIPCMLLQGCISPTTGIDNTVKSAVIAAPAIANPVLNATVLNSTETTKDPSLYSALGEQAGISAIVDGLLAGIAGDQRIVHHFKEVDIRIFRQRLIEYLCLITQGGCVYLGDSMAESHQGLHITQAHFDALVGHLIHSMKQQSVPLATRNALLKMLASKYQDISYR